mmetsp:Transcript_104740/g.291694  ORF Transcript_104740/g.291694 Transcript_104740/m.291694 type:complete len:251 (-) Transcript_104740:753-1505(-)
MMDPKIAKVDMFETISVTKQMISVTRKMKPNSLIPTPARHCAIQSASSDFTVPCAIIIPPPKTKRISHLNPLRTACQSRMFCGLGSGARDWHRSSPMHLRSRSGSLFPQGMKKSGRVSPSPMAPLLSFGATNFFQPGKPLIGDAVNHNTTSIKRSAATTTCSKPTLPSAACMPRKSSRSTGIFFLLCQTYVTQKPSQTTTSNKADNGRAQRQNLANENSSSEGQNFENCSMKMPLVGVPTGVAMPPMVAL